MRLVRLGYACNNACLFCAQGVLRRSDSGPDEAAMKRQLTNISGEIIAFVGGEPTLFDSLLDWIRAAKAAGAHSVLVQTNGRRLAYSSYADALAEAGIDGLDISLHGSTSAMHEYHTSAAGSFSQTLTGMAHARKAGISFGVTTVITRSNFRHLGDIVRIAHARGASGIHFAMAAREGRARDTSARIIAPAELVKPHLVSALSLARSLGLETLAHRHASSEAARSRFAGIGDVAPLGTPAT